MFSCAVVDGRWSLWGQWSTCSKSCGPGEQERKRECNNPQPSNGGKQCEGDAKQTQSCTTNTAGDDIHDIFLHDNKTLNSFDSHKNIFEKLRFLDGDQMYKILTSHPLLCNGYLVTV